MSPSTFAMTKLKNQLTKINPALKVELKNIRINGQLRGCSGFVTNPANGNIAYLNTDSSLSTMLYRTATSTRDYRGGQNRFAKADDLPRAVATLLSS